MACRGIPGTACQSSETTDDFGVPSVWLTGDSYLHGTGGRGGWSLSERASDICLTWHVKDLPALAQIEPPISPRVASCERRASCFLEGTATHLSLNSTTKSGVPPYSSLQQTLSTLELHGPHPFPIVFPAVLNFIIIFLEKNLRLTYLSC